MKTIKTYNATNKEFGVLAVNNNSVDEVFETEEEAKERAEELSKMDENGEKYEVVRVAESIRNIRATTGLSQAKFAAFYNIPKRTLESWEVGERECPGYVVELLRRAVKEDF